MKRGDIRLLFVLFLILFLLALPLVLAAQLKVTSEHPFLVNNEWISASDLKVGDKLSTIDGKTARITGIKTAEEKAEVYNLESSFYHDFVVEDGVIVHNSNAPKPFTCDQCLSGQCVQSGPCGSILNKIAPSNQVCAHTNEGNFISIIVSRAITSAKNIRTVFKTDLGGGIKGAKVIVDGRTGRMWFWQGDRDGVHHIGMSARAYVQQHPGTNEFIRWNNLLGNKVSAKEALRYYGFELQLHPDGTITAIRSGLTEEFKQFVSNGAYRDLPVLKPSATERDNAIRVLQEQLNVANTVRNPTNPNLPIVDPNFKQYKMTDWGP